MLEIIYWGLTNINQWWQKCAYINCIICIQLINNGIPLRAHIQGERYVFIYQGQNQIKVKHFSQTCPCITEIILEKRSAVYIKLSLSTIHRLLLWHPKSEETYIRIFGLHFNLNLSAFAIFLCISWLFIFLQYFILVLVLLILQLISQWNISNFNLV